ncbi:Protein FAM171A1 [Microtus ochrogaster]|uniref:Protein FAM171A1 n=1 Tax=Microtus ochrogaster TaxID=79684 RepID=A0A8J6FYZ6_MICOH|nr:Protein FAM171A1 [Microtus ochrogaster]
MASPSLFTGNVYQDMEKTSENVSGKVTLKVHVSDASTHQPIADALIEIFANQVSVASGTSGADGVAFIKFQYKLGNQLIVTATKHAYVPNSAPWKPIRLPVFSSLSLGLLPERSATLMVYEDVVQIVSGFQGARPQPRVHFQRRALRLPENTSYSDLTAFLTAASSPSEVDSFPYLRGLDGNGTGNSTRYDLTPFTAVSVHLQSSNGTPVLVDGPIYVTVPLATQSSLRHNAYIAAWRFDQKLGLVPACVHMEAPFQAPAQSTQLPQNITRHRTLRRALSALPLVSPVKNPSLVPHLRHNDHFCAPVCKWETLLLLLPKREILIILPQQGLSDEKHVFPAHSSLVLMFPIAFPHTKKPKTWKMLMLVTAQSNPTAASHFCRCLLCI